MIYVAKHYTKIAGRKYTPGEIIDRPIPDDKRERLLRLRAIEGMDVSGENDAGDFTKSDETKGGAKGEHKAQEADVAEAAGEIDAEDEAEEAPEIDAMDGIVSAESVKKNGRGRRKAQ